MPGVIPLTDAQRRAGAGWTDTLIADAATSGEPMALSVHRIELQAGTTSEPQCLGADEGFVYIVSGTGVATSDGDTYELAPESVLWLDAGDPEFVVTAGPTGLTLLLTRAPGN